MQFSWTNFVESMFAMEGLNIDPPINGSEPVVVEAVPYFLQLFNALRQYSPRYSSCPSIGIGIDSSKITGLRLEKISFCSVLFFIV